jgi:hypothetical protein
MESSVTNEKNNTPRKYKKVQKWDLNPKSNNTIDRPIQSKPVELVIT